MSKFKSKLARRVMAILLSGAMVMSNMSVYAAELSTETTTEVVEEVATEVESEAEKTEEADVSDDNNDAEAQSSESEASTVEEKTTEEAETDETDETSTEAETQTETEALTETQTMTEEETTEVECSGEETSEVESSGSEENGSSDEDAETVHTLDIGALISAGTLEAKTYESTTGTDVLNQTIGIFTLKSGGAKYTIDGTDVSVNSNDDANLTFTGRIKVEGAGNTEKRVISFEADAGAKIVAYFQTGKNGEARDLALSDGNQVLKQESNSVSGTPTKLEYETTSSGTYYLYGLANIQIFYVSVTPPSGGQDTPSERGSWTNVAAPEIAGTTYDMSAKDTSISVKVKGVIDKTGEGADKLTVYMYDTKDITNETEPVATQPSTANTTADEEDGNHYTTVTFKPEASGDYYFKAVLERSVDTDTDYADKESALSDAVAFKLPLNTPVISKAEFKETASDGTGTITVSWGAVTEADYYVIAMTYSDDANSGNAIESATYKPTEEESEASSFSTDITGLAAGSTVKVTVQAVRGTATGDEVADIDKSEVSSARTVTLEVVEVAEGTYVFESKNLTSLSAAEDMQRIPLTDDEYFVLVARKGKPGLYDSDTEYEFDDGYTTARLMKFGGNWSASTGNWIEFTTQGSAEIKVWWQTSDAGRAVALYDTSMNELSAAAAGEKNGAYLQKFTVTEGGTYRIASSKAVGEAKDIRIAKIEVTEGAKVNAEYTFDGASVYTAEIKAETYNDGDAVSYVDDYFTVLYSKTAKVEAKSYPGAWADGYGGGYRLNFGGTAATDKNAIKFTTTEDEATVRIWWKAGADGRHVQLLDASGNQVAVSSDEEGEGAAATKDTSYITKFKLTSAGTYYLGNESGNNYLFKVKVTEGHEEDPVAWDTVAAPVIQSAAQASDADGALTGNITVTVAAYIDEIKGCEKVTVEMYGEDPSANENAEALATASSSKTTASAEGTVSVTFTPTASGNYYFIARASRAEERTTKDSAVYAMANKFILPLTAPSITRATNDGKGGIEIAYNSVAEADKYIAAAVQVTKNEDGTYTPVEGAEAVTAESVVTEDNAATTATLTGLTVGQYYAFTVHAVRGEEEGKESEAFYKIVKDAAEQVWDYSSFGESTSTNTAQCGYSGDVNDGEATVWSLGGKGKIVPASTDGVSFLYTKIDKDTNFVLEATAVVDEWTYSNGQEGFGLMVADTVGPHGHGTKFWNNSYMAVATKMEYYWNGSKVLPTSVGAGDDRVRYNMYLGLGSIARTGVTDEWEAEQAAGATIPSKFVSQQLSLEHAAGSKGLVTGDYNIIGNAKAKKANCIDVDPLTEIKLRIEKNNTGYFVTYIDKDGEETTHKFYEDRAIVDKDYANQSLLQIDKDYMYVGFFAARNAKATFKDISFTTSSVDDGGEPEEKPITYNTPTYTIVSGSVSNTPEYDINFSTNWNGTLSIKDSAGRELVNEAYFEYLANQQTTVLSGGSYVPVSMLDKFFEYETDEEGKRISGTEILKADVKAVIPINDDVNAASKLAIGANKFTVSFTPDRSWHLNDDELQMLSSYDTSVQTLTVSYRQYGEEGSNIYAAPDGKATGDGTKEAPLDIFTAVKYAQAGQTIVLLKGTYSLKKTLVIERGVDGTADKPIRMIAEPGSYDRTNPFTPSGVVIDFNGIASGMTIAGDYWYFRGFDVTNSSDGNKGIQVSGSHNTLDQVNTYYNGNTGIQISRYKGTDIDKSDDWPSYNTILNCTSYLNADSGHEDADGFAAKLTIGDGNVFDGCIAAYNADDGWDFFAKSESGPIGQVIIKNSVTFKNGYMLIDANGKLDVNGKEQAGKGNGNGFKMGGESIKGYHMVVNSYSFYNKAKGIDSNSCPDIQAYNCISYNNKNYNVAFYTGVASYTEYRAGNLISFRTDAVTADTDAAKDQLKPVTPSGATDLNDYTGASNFYWNADKSVAENKDGKTVTADWFKSLEFKGINTVSRNANGTINMGDFLALSDKADTSAFVKLEESTNENGAKIYKVVEGVADVPAVGGQASDDTSAVVDESKDTTGNIISGDDEDVSTTDTWTDEELAQIDANGDTLKILLDLDYDSEGRYYTDYTGVAIKPAVRVAYGPNELSTKNYSVSYKNNIKAYELRPGDEGFDEKLAPAVVIKGKGNYSGEYKLYFVINKIDMASDKVTSADITTVATGRAQKINPAVTFDGKKLGTKEYTINRVYTLETVKAEDGTETVEEKSYTGSYESAGTYYIGLKGADLNFTGIKIVTVKVLSAEEAASKTPMSKVKVDKIPDQVYDGTAHCPAVTVTGLIPSSVDAEGNYVAGDYDVEYRNNTDIGIASVVLTGNVEKGYYGTKVVTFKTVAKPLNVKDYAVTVKGTFDGKTYTATTDEEYKSLSIPSTGSAITFSNVAVNVISNEGSASVRLTEGVDYTVSYKGNTKAGTASIVIKGMGDFKGRLTRSFKITPYEITESNTTVEPIGAQTYTKGGVKPSVIVKVNGKVVSSSNYTVSYKNNNKVGTASVSITGKNLLKGSLKDARTFDITAKNLLVTDAAAENVYYGTAKKAGDLIAYATKLTVKDGTKKLSLNSDYTVTYYESDQFDEKLFDYKTGAAYINKTNEDGTVAKVAGTPLEKNSKITYTGANKTIYAVITAGKNGFYTGAAYTSYRVVGKNDLRYAKITKISDVYTYNDSTVSAPKLEVKIQNRHLEDGKYVKDTEYTSLKLNQDYEIISIKNNDRAGTATITIQGMGYYSGTNKATFKIAKKDLTAWNAYIANTIVLDIVVDVNEADVVEGGKYYKEYAEKQFGSVIDFDDITIVTKDEEGNDIKTTETSPLAKAAVGKIYTVGTKTSGALTYGTDYTVTEYSNNVITSLDFDEDGYAYQAAAMTIKGAGNYTGSKTITFTIRVKKTAE